MSLLVPDVGEVLLLQKALNKVAADDVKIHLYSSNYTPVEGDTITATDSFGLIADPAAIVLTGANWTVSTSTGTTTAEHAQQTFTFTGAATVYGYVVTNNAETEMLWAERFTDGPYTIPAIFNKLALITEKLLANFFNCWKLLNNRTISSQAF